MLEWLPWQDAAAATAVTAGAVGATRNRLSPWAVRLRPWARELTLVLLLYALWQYAGAWSHGQTGAARARGAWIWRTERVFHLPSEQSLQALVLPHRGLVHWLNEFYVQAHAPGLGLLLVWLFVRHRDRYPQVRTVIVLVTGACLAIQLWPVAPPRLLSGLGLVDTGALVGPSDYAGGSPGIDQLSAMPSVHVAWALIVGGAVVWASRSRWRWLAAAYPVVTTFVVVVTANHYWADGLAAALLCLLAVGAVALAARAPGRRHVAAPAVVPALAPAVDPTLPPHTAAARDGRRKAMSSGLET